MRVIVDCGGSRNFKPGVRGPGAVEFLGSEVCCDAPFIHTLCREQNTYCKHCMMASVKIYACYAVKIYKHSKNFQTGGARPARRCWIRLLLTFTVMIVNWNYTYGLTLNLYSLYHIMMKSMHIQAQTVWLIITTTAKRYSKILIFNIVCINGRAAYFAPVLMKMSCCEFCMNTLDVKFNTPQAWFPICYGDVKQV